MSDTRATRRAAERSARQALDGTVVGAIGDLGVALVGKADARGVVAAAKERGAEIVAAAQQEAGAIIGNAHEVENSAGEVYAKAWHAAREAGWSPAQLTTMGYVKPTGKERRGTTRTRGRKLNSGDATIVTA